MPGWPRLPADAPAGTFSLLLRPYPQIPQVDSPQGHGGGLGLPMRAALEAEPRTLLRGDRRSPGRRSHFHGEV